MTSDHDHLHHAIHIAALALIASALAIALLVMNDAHKVGAPWGESITGVLLGFVLALLWQQWRSR